MAFGRIVSVLPQMPQYRVPLGFQINSISTNATGAAFSYVHAVGEIGTPVAMQYSLEKTEEYRLLQESHQRRVRVRSLIQELMPGSLDRFEAASRAVDQFRLGTGAKSAAASELRNLIDGVQGELFEKARRSPKENMTWQTMASRLLPNLASAADIILSQERVRTALYGDLSQATKLREGQREQRIEDMSARVLDHLFAVLSLVKSGGAV